MPDQKTVNRSTVDTSDPVVPESSGHEPDAVQPDGPESESARERAGLVGAAEPTPDGAPDPDAPMAPDAAATTDSLDADRAPGAQADRDALAARDADSAQDAEADRNAEAASDAHVTPETPTDRDAFAARDVEAEREAPDALAAPDDDPSRAVETPQPTPDGPIGTADPTSVADGSTPGPDRSTELAPGEAPASAPTTLWAGEDSEALRERWAQLQAHFVDDPHAAAAAADDLIGEAVETITEALAAQRQQLGQWRAGGDFDTERLRVAVTGYRDFLDRVLSI